MEPSSVEDGNPETGNGSIDIGRASFNGAVLS